MLMSDSTFITIDNKTNSLEDYYGGSNSQSRRRELKVFSALFHRLQKTSILSYLIFSLSYLPTLWPYL